MTATPATPATPVAAANAAGSAVPALVVEAFDVYRGLQVSVHVDRLWVDPGEIVALVGGPGSGKSTLLRGMGGLEPSRGLLQLAGGDLGPLPAHQRARAGLGLVAHHGRVSRQVTIAELLDLPWSLERAVDRRRWRSPAPAPGEPWSLYELADHLPGLDRVLHLTLADVGAWERQAVAIALALRSGPSVVMVDEPGAGLGDVSLERLRQSLRTIATRGVAVIMATRNASLAGELADRRLRLEQGRLLTAPTAGAVPGPAGSPRRDGVA
ncbi:MAG: ATP-binding cassette domain-containing protein [Acidimicrobiales bacterium]